MQLTKLKKITDLQEGEIIALSNKNIEDKQDVSLNFAKVENFDIDENTKKVFGVYLRFSDKVLDKFYLSDNLLGAFNFYKISDDGNLYKHNECLIKRNIQLEKSNKKAERLNKKYRAMLIKRFGATEKQIDSNFNNEPKEKDSFIVYGSEMDKFPIFEENKIVYYRCKISYSKNKKNHIKCTVKVYDKTGNEICEASSVAICHKEDKFNRQIGEYISSTKTFTKITCMMH